MSRIGGKKIIIPSGVKLEQNKGLLNIRGQKGEVSFELPSEISCAITDNEVQLKMVKNTKNVNTAVLGLYRSLIDNAIVGVSNGHERTLDLVGIGYRAQLKGSDLELALGYSHPIIYKAPADITVKLEGNTIIHVQGCDKQKVGQTCADIRAFRPPEPYKGKGIRYRNEHIILKAGKSAKS